MRKLARSTFNGVTFARKITSLVSFLFFLLLLLLFLLVFLLTVASHVAVLARNGFRHFFSFAERRTHNNRWISFKQKKSKMATKKEQPGRGKRSWWGEKKNGVVCTRRYEKITLHMKVMKARGRGKGGGGA